MKLLHAFPRPRHYHNSEGKLIRKPPTDEDRQHGLEILRLILTHGLLCKPEKFKLYPNCHTENEKKKICVQAGNHYDEIVQSRACFTLAESIELSKEYEPSQAQPARYYTHTDLFGEFAIGLDPIEARKLGILPTVYSYRYTEDAIAGLGAQIVERLDEIRYILSILSYIEAKANPYPENSMLFPSIEKLKSWGINIEYEPEIEGQLAKIKTEKAAMIFRLFDTDRVPAWNIFDFVQMLLSLYQTTDSTVEDAPLAFFQQREWRLIHHMVESLRWFGLGDHPTHRNPLAVNYGSAISEIKDFMHRTNPHSNKDLTWVFNHCWVLVGTREHHFRDFIQEIIVPKCALEPAKAILSNLDFACARPVITPLPPRWRIAVENNIPCVVRGPDSPNQ